jgi:hypothetical protein
MMGDRVIETRAREKVDRYSMMDFRGTCYAIDIRGVNAVVKQEMRMSRHIAGSPLTFIDTVQYL